MKMHEEMDRRSGSSDARSRQGGDIVPVPPRSGSCKSCDGLPAVLLARTAGELAIAKKLIRRRKERKREESPPLIRLRGGGDSCEEEEEETEPFAGFTDLTDVEDKFIDSMMKDLKDEKDLGNFLFVYMENAMCIILDTKIQREARESHGKILAYIAKEGAEALVARVEKAERKCKKLEKEKGELLQQQKEDRKKIEELENRMRKETKNNQEMDVEEGEQEQGGEGVVMKKLDEILRRVRVLEGKEEKAKDLEREDRTPWNKVIGRRDKRDQVRQERRDIEEGKRNADKENKKEDTYGRRKRNETTLQAVKRSLPKGAGVLLELQGGTQQEYQEVLKNCQERIKLDELGIPPVGLRKARGGGILLEIRCNGNDEEKARMLAEKMKEVVGTVEGARIRCPLRRLRIRLSGLPFNAVASEIAEAIARLGRGRADSVRVGPLRTSWSGAGSAWAVCPAEVAVRAAEAAELTLGWARVGVTLERGGPAQCHRCLARGHLRRWCPSGVSRGACCLRCGRNGHQIGQCGQKPHCPICEERGLQADHRPGDPSVCRPVPPGADREARSPRERPEKPPSPDPVEGPGGGVNEKEKGASVPGGDSSPPGAEAPSSLDPGEGSSGVRQGPAAGPGDDRVSEGRPSGRLWGVDLSPSGSDMETEPEEEGSRKRKSQDTRECSVVLAPLPAPQEKGGKGKKKKKR